MDTLQDRYEIQRQLGKKAGRQTLLAVDRITQQPVILKLLSFNSDFEWDDLKLFEREIETLKSLDHPAIPKYLDSFELNRQTQKGYVLVQSYLEAPSLEEHLQAGRSFSESEVKEIVRSLLEILRDLHDRHPPIIHRDIKPSNILLTDRSGNSPGKVYLIDFGSVQTLATQAGKTVTVVGTYGYMPPEQFGGISSPASDLYSVGMTAIALLTGTHPADLPHDNLRIQFKPRVSVSPALMEWIQKMTEPHPDQRFRSAPEALNQLTAPIERSSPPKPVSTTPSFVGEAIAHSVAIGLKTCIVVSALGTFIGILTAGPGGFVLGLFATATGIAWGTAVGVLNGLIVGIISQLRLYSLRDARKHYLTISIASAVSLIVVICVAFTIAAPDRSGMSATVRSITFPFILLAAIAMQYANYQLNQHWYGRKKK